MVGRTDDKEFLQVRTNQLLMETLDGSRAWQRKADKRASTKYRVLVPEDGEDYKVVMSIMKVGSNGDSRFVLASHETGLFADSYKLRSRDYEPLAQLGKAIFSD